MNLREEILKNSGLLVEMPVRRKIIRDSEGKIGITIYFEGNSGLLRNANFEADIPWHMIIDYDECTENQVAKAILKSRNVEFVEAELNSKDTSLKNTSEEFAKNMNSKYKMFAYVAESTGDSGEPDYDNARSIEIKNSDNKNWIYKKLISSFNMS